MFKKLPELDDSQAPGYILCGEICKNKNATPESEMAYHTKYILITVESDGSNPKSPDVGPIRSMAIAGCKFKGDINNRFVESNSTLLAFEDEDVPSIVIYEGIGPTWDEKVPEFGLYIEVNFQNHINDENNRSYTLRLDDYTDLESPESPSLLVN